MGSDTPDAAPPVAVVVNDDRTQLSALTGLLGKAGIAARGYESAEAALSAMSLKGPPDLIVTDLYMPGIDGWRFCRLLRSSEYADLNRVPILVVSATFSGEEPERIAADLGAEAFLQSPVDSRRLLDHVRAILRGERGRRAIRVLVCEGKGSEAAGIAETFRAAGYLPHVAPSLKEAMEAFGRLAIDVVVLDDQLPDGPGETLLHACFQANPDCVCLMMTSNPDPDLALRWMRCGAAAYVRKPFDPAYLLDLCARARRERALLRVQDLLEQRTRELRESEEKYRRLFAYAGDAVFVHELTDTGLPGRFLEINAAACTRLGYIREELLGMGVFDVNAPSDRDMAPEILGRLRKEGQLLFEGTLVRKDGTAFPVEVSSHLFPLGERDVVLSICRDITERKEAEETLRTERERYRTLLQTAMDGFCMMDLQGRILESNVAFCRLTGYSAEELRCLKISDLEAVETPAETEGHLRRIMDEGQDRFESRHRRKDGTLYPIEVSAQYLPVEGGRLVAFARDITERRCVEEERERLQAQLAQAQKMESMGRLAGGVAHDFNNMLAVILGHTELALMEIPKGAPLQRKLEQVQKTALRSVELVRQLLAFARKQTVSPRALELNRAVEGTLKMIRHLIGEDIDLVWRPGAPAWKVRMDPSQIDQILANLCINAKDAIPGVGRVMIETTPVLLTGETLVRPGGLPPGEYALLAVSDNGCGMDMETRGRIFEPFFTTKEVGKGTGLGLAMVYGIVTQNQGAVEVESEPGKGTVFRIYLPRCAKEEEGPHEQAPLDTLPRGRETVLLVEDEPGLLEMGQGMLEQLGYNVLPALTPKEALRVARDHPGEIHLLLTDVIMPGMNGKDLAERLKEACPAMKCLFMSGYSAEVIARHGVLTKEIRFLRKPFTLMELASRVREALGATDPRRVPGAPHLFRESGDGNTSART